MELRIVDAALARALFHGVPAARLLARVRLAYDEGENGEDWDTFLGALLGRETATFDRVKRAIARHARVAFDEGPLQAAEDTIAVLVLAVATDNGEGQSLAEIAVPSGLAPIAPGPRQASAFDEAVLSACAAFDDRIAAPDADKRAPAFEACVRMASRAMLGPMAWEQLNAIATQLERPPIGVQLFRDGSPSIFPPASDDELALPGLRMAMLDRTELDELVSRDPRELGSAVWRTDNAPGGDAGTQLATFLADLTRLLAHAGNLVVGVVRLRPPSSEEEHRGEVRGAPPSWIPASWSSSAAAALADALERGATTVPRVRTEVTRGGAAALDAISAEMLHVGTHPFASAAFAEILARGARPRDVIRLVTYFAIAQDPAPAARALAVCTAPELPRVLSAWLEAMLPQADDDPSTSGAERVTACVAALKPYPHLYRAVQPLLSRLTDAPPPSA
jgi:hypothetical protein